MKVEGNVPGAFPRGDYYYILIALIIIAWVLIGQVVLAGEQESNKLPPVVARSEATKQSTTGCCLSADLDCFACARNDGVLGCFAYARNDEVRPDTALTDSGLLWLINQDNPLPPTFTPQNLAAYQGIRLHASALAAYTAMLAAMQAEGGAGNLQLVSAYRPYDYQRSLFDKKVRELISQGYSAADADALAEKSIQRPGASEHQTGLALDVTVTGQLTQDFAATAAGQWLAANSYRFGFIIRYPQHKTEITQIIYEPWHLRYVGIPHAQIIWENGITLEEYAQFIAAGPYIVWHKNGSGAYYLVVHSQFLPIEKPHGLIDISSTRHGGGVGYIITFRRY